MKLLTLMKLLSPSLLMGLLSAALVLAASTRAMAQEYTFTTLAGPAEVGPGDADGTGSAAHFRVPCGTAVDSAGNVYVADSSNGTIRKVTPAGGVTTLAGLAGSYGSADGTGNAARFYYPASVAVDSAGNVYVADANSNNDSNNNNTIRKVTRAGVVTTLAGLAGSSGNADGTGSAARFYSPQGLAVDSAGNVYVADTRNHTIRKVTPAGVVTTLAGLAGSSGSANGTGSAARFYVAYGLAVDSAGNVYVADTWNCTIRKVTPSGVVTTLAGLTGSSERSADGTGSAARFDNPSSVAADSAGNLYVADTANNTIRKVTPEGVVTTLAGLTGRYGNAGGTGSAARFFFPSGLTVDSSGNVYVADTRNSTIRKVAPGGVVTTLAGLEGSSGSADGTGSNARFYSPYSVAVDSAGNVYAADTRNFTIRKVTPDGVVTTLAGLAGSSGSADGTGSAARFYCPWGVAAGSAGNVYVADSNNHTIRKVTPGGVVTTLAGLAGSSGSADGTGSAARFNDPYGVAVDSAGNVYVADSRNHTIRKVTPGGEVTTLAGLAGYAGSADGTGSDARFFLPYGVAVDSAGNVYVADNWNSTIRKVTPGGLVTTVAGLAGSSGSADGTGSAAQFFSPQGVAVDSASNLYVADTYNSTIRLGRPACPDAPTIDLLTGPVGQARQLDTSPQSAVAWQWRLVRIPATSALASWTANVRNPTFTPDVADTFVFRLTATNAAGAIAIRTLAFTALPPPPVFQRVKLTQGTLELTWSTEAGASYQLEYLSDLNSTNWTSLRGPLTATGPTLSATDYATNGPARFYRTVRLPAGP
jgi:sugar lactone lactonase YvrE